MCQAMHASCCCALLLLLATYVQVYPLYNNTTASSYLHERRELVFAITLCCKALDDLYSSSSTVSNSNRDSATAHMLPATADHDRR
jgi:hypothetical protein